MFGATATFFLALSLLPLAEVSTLASTTPLIIVGLAGPLLGERVARSAIVGAVIGFAGVLILVGVDPSQLSTRRCWCPLRRRPRTPCSAC